MRSWGERRRVARIVALFEAINQRKFGYLDHVFGAQVMVNGHPWSPRALQADMERLVEAFPDFQWTIQHLVAEGNLVSVRYCDRGTSMQPYGGHAPVRRQLDLQEMVIYQFDGPLVTNMWISSGQALARESTTDYLEQSDTSEDQPYPRP